MLYTENLKTDLVILKCDSTFQRNEQTTDNPNDSYLSVYRHSSAGNQFSKYNYLIGIKGNCNLKSLISICLILNPVIIKHI